MTFAELKLDVYRHIGLPTSPATGEVTRIAAEINEGLRVLYSLPALRARLLRTVADVTPTVTITSVADQARYVVRNAVSQILGISDRTNDYALQPMTRDEYRLRMPDPTAESATPTHYVLLGHVGLETLPSDASQIFVKSTSASDNTQTVVARFVRTGGVFVGTSASLNGTTAVTLNANITDVVDVSDWFLSAAAVGTVTLHEDSGAGTQLAAIPIGATRARYLGLYLWPTPSDAITYAVDFRQLSIEMSQDMDEPLLPLDYHYLLSIYAQMKHFGVKVGDARGLELKAQWREGVNNLIYSVAMTDPIVVPGGLPLRDGSNLGPYFPPGRW